MARRDLRLLAFVGALALVMALGHTATGLSADFLFMAPAVMLLLPLAAGRYPGEHRLSRLMRPTRTSRRDRLAAHAPSRAVVRVPPRGGCLLAFSLAVRPPPVAPQLR